MGTNRQAFGARSNQLVIVPVSAANLKYLNDETEQAMLSLTNSKGGASLVSKISDSYHVFDIEREHCHMIFVHRENYRPGFQSCIGKVVKFSKWCYSPCRAKDLRLATPACYRDEESLPPGIGDRYDSTLRKDASPWMRKRFLNNSVEAEVVFSSSSEPWVYCTSHLPTHFVYGDLKTKFLDEYGYNATTEIKDVDAFAMWLGIDFALQIDKRNHLKLSAFDMATYLKSSYSTDLWQQNGPQNIETFVHVYHGPVHYEDESGVVTTDEDMVDIHGSVRAWFTKRTEFADQSEYRFVVTTLGIPCSKTLKMQVSDELRQLTSAV